VSESAPMGQQHVQGSIQELRQITKNMDTFFFPVSTDNK